ncbi:hypothetical protein PR048_017314 [Dryococelus australis]|uniref:Uncharacterized protein n=1 Tax=Dryococelus australis TaxID=614101 RepID=A0ABQ9H959_9NEOP|nr:hypothetical protein PR048_017314 [Dryococelus australis]
MSLSWLVLAWRRTEGDPLFTRQKNKKKGSKFREEVEKLDENGPTAKLWIQYFKMANLMKEFINDEWSESISVQKLTMTRMYLEYGLAPLSLALFNESGMRQTKKSGMCTVFNTTKKDWNPANFDIVVYGGFLMHKVIWPKECTVSTICEAYIKYGKSHYPRRSCCVVFDGYTISRNSTKAAEQEQWHRMKKSSDIILNVNTEFTDKQDHLLSNEQNKSRLITLLKSQLNENGIETIYKSNKQLDKSTIAVIVGDVDLAVLLMAKTPPDQDNLLVKPGQGKIKTNVYSTRDGTTRVKRHSVPARIPGCDQTSEAFRKSKVGFIKLYQKNHHIHKATEVFSQSTSTHTQALERGGKCLLRWYGATAKEISLNLYHYQVLVKSVANIKADISSLPPIEGAAK